jgi:thiamine biosynthesis lipoprotein
MNNKVLVVSMIIVLVLFSCRGKEHEYGNFTGFTQGTTYSIVYQDPAKITTKKLKEAVENIFRNFDMSLSLYIDSSLISKINRNEDVIPDTFFIGVFKKSEEISVLTDGAFDITVGPLVKAWGFGPDEHKNFDRSKLDSLMGLVGFRKISLIDGRLFKSNPGICLDVNAIAQGYSVDVICRYFNSLGIESYLVEIGGEVRAKGDKNGEFWRIGIDKPFDNNMSPGTDLQAIIKLKDRALATSGNYRKFYIENGIKYSHTIDPKTGYPAKNQLLSATIIAKDCATADGIATACMVMGKDRAIEFINRNKNFDAYLVYSDDNGNFITWMSENLRNNISGKLSY